jgi:hypothetical protein
MTDFAVTGTSVRVAVPRPDVLDRRMKAADRPGEHMWIVTAAWQVLDPERDRMNLDTENLLDVSGIGCFKCERIYSRKLARMPCHGSVTEVQP